MPIAADMVEHAPAGAPLPPAGDRRRRAARQLARPHGASASRQQARTSISPGHQKRERTREKRALRARIGITVPEAIVWTSHGLRQDQGHRAAGVARPRRRGGARGRGRAARPAGGSRARTPDADPRLSQGQGPAAGGDPAARPRGGARRGAAQLARHAGTSTRSTPPASPRSASPSSTSASCRARASRSPSRSRSACARGPRSASTRVSRSAGASRSVEDAAVDAELERLRERFATLETVERAAAAAATTS